jgi:uncharacterized membrane protein SpoIIM required for sporulation
MKEIVFIRNGLKKWAQYETIASSPEKHTADELADVYTDITADLAFAQTNYPNSDITTYLNNLTLSIHNLLYGVKKEKASRILTFFTHEIPLTVYAERRNIIISLIIFTLCAIIGAVSTFYDHEFPRIILGDYYVDMSLSNIERGEPMDVYKSGSQISSFLGIMGNNIMVASRTFIFGIFTSLGTAFFLYYNGVMLGAFQMFFINHNMFWQSFLAIWLHGTLEISAIIIAGGAGITMGNGWLFPGTLPRFKSFVIAGRRGLKVMISTVPIFIVAAFVEGFFTRYTHASSFIRLSFILLCLCFVLFYYVFLPIARHREEKRKESEK